jgi:hypothetical protein
MIGLGQWFFPSLELDPMEHLRARVIIYGIVQGVWFRQSTKDEATRIGGGMGHEPS